MVRAGHGGGSSRSAVASRALRRRYNRTVHSDWCDKRRIFRYSLDITISFVICNIDEGEWNGS